VLDPILHMYVEEDKDLRSIVQAGFDEKVVERVICLVDRNEYKRRQAAPGVKITPKAFGKDRRLPSRTATAAGERARRRTPLRKHVNGAKDCSSKRVPGSHRLPALGRR